MVDKIYRIKNQIIEDVEKEIGERGADRVSPEKIDMIKDLAEAEESCWKAQYYRSVTEAMGGQGSGYGSMGARSGYGAGTGSSAGYGQQASGHTDATESLRMMLKNANPDERQRIRNEVMSMIGAM